MCGAFQHVPRSRGEAPILPQRADAVSGAQRARHAFATEMARTANAGSSSRPAPIRVRFGAFELDEANASLLREGTAIALAPTPFAVLCALVRRRGSLLATNALLDEVWGHQFVSDSVLRTAISEIRTALGDDARQPRFIQTVSRRGYRFIADAADLAKPYVHASATPPPAQRVAPFVGRAEPLARLRSAWDRACGGTRQIVWIAGEAGVGKTTLVEHFVASLGTVACARGQCVEHDGTGEPYLPVLEALSELCRSNPALVPTLRDVAPTWLLQMPWFTTAEERDRLRQELAGVAAERMIREMGALLDRSGEREPLLLITEDLHWSDRATIQLMDYLARRRGSARLMWLATFRLAEVVALEHPLNRLRRELRIHGLTEEIVLDPFSESEVARYIAELAPSIPIDEPFVRAVQERTDGLPLFVESIVTEMSARAERGRAVGTEQIARIAVPESLAAIIEHYVAGLDGDRRTLLSAAAACGVQFEVRTVASALDRDEAWVADLCARLARERLWLALPVEGESAEDASSFAFRHALFRQVLYERTPSSVRAQLHRRVGAALERDRLDGAPVAPSDLATHFERGGDSLRAARYHAEAAEAALAYFNPEDCLGITERAMHALAGAANGQERCRVELSLHALHGLAATRILGAGDQAKSAFRHAFDLLADDPEHPMRGRLLHGYGFMLCMRAEYADALAVADRAEALASLDNDPVLGATACTVHGQVDHLQGRSWAAREWLERGLARTEHLDVAPGEFFVDPHVAQLGLIAVPLLHLGLVRQARACLEQAERRARDRGFPMARLACAWYAALFEVRLGNIVRVAGLAEEMRGIVEQFDLAHGRTAHRWYSGWADARRGRAREGFSRIREAHDDNVRLGMMVGSSEVLGYAAEALLIDGDVDGAEAQLREAFGAADNLRERVYLPQLHLAEAAIAYARGQREAGEASIRRGLREARDQRAPWLELIAFNELLDRGVATPKDRASLAKLLDAMPEASDTEAVARARALLAT